MNILKSQHKNYELSDHLFSIIHRQLNDLGYEWTDQTLVRAITELSDHFNQNQVKQTLWSEKKFQAAYLAYFFPLNVLRLLSLKNEIDFLFKDSSEIIDFGSGPGTFHVSLLEVLKLPFQTITCIEKNKTAIDLHQKILSSLNKPTKVNWIKENDLATENKIGVFCYSINELNNIPNWIYNFESVIILEPSTQFFGRKLMELRSKLIQQNFETLAPCTHQNQCPLLAQSKKDWCHQRIAIQMPNPWMELEKKLPMKNNTLTFSYLIASKKHKNLFSNKIRIIGDTLKEKGKTKQAICRNEQREFLSWLNKNKNTQDIPRGSIIELRHPHQKKSNEIRI